MVLNMKTLVAYYSRTGNTKKIAEAIYGELEGQKDIIPIDRFPSSIGYDMVFIGSPIEKHGLVACVYSFIKNIPCETKVALFITHAAPEQSQFAASYIEACEKIVGDSSKLIGIFNCQGELSSKLAERMLKSDESQLRKFAEMRRFTLNQPDEARLDRSRQFARKMQEKLSIFVTVRTTMEKEVK